MQNKEFEFKGLAINGFAMILFLLLIAVASVLSITKVYASDTTIIIGLIVLAIDFFCFFGFRMQEPNEGMVMLFFGKYRGTFTRTGFYWVNFLLSSKRVSLRARNLNVDPIKVNDKMGNPVMIGQILVWKLKDTYKAMFEIDSQTIATNVSGVTVGGKSASVAGRMRAFESFVKVQSDAALREVAGMFAYDDNDDNDNQELTLRSGGTEINDILLQKLNERLAMSGLEVIEARINYLAYSPEIAAVMLRRQQAVAIIAAREKIVEGAVTMVRMALDRLKEDQVVDLDEDKKAAMVSNLLVVLCADDAAQPVINTGTLNQ